MKNKMFLIFLLTLILEVFFNTNSFAKDILTLNKEMKDILNKVCPKFELIVKSDLNAEMRKYLDDNKETYSTVIRGDFNNDKLVDIALLIKCKYKNKKDVRSIEKLVVLIQKANGKYDIIVLEENSFFSDEIYLRAIAPGDIVEEFGSEKKVDLINIGIERVYFEKSFGVFYWEDGKFRYIHTSD